MALQYETRPISERTWQKPRARTQTPFRTTWSATLDLLEHEYDALGGHHLVIEVDVEERMIRNDGRLRADARSSSPAIVVAFDSKHGPLLYRCDRYETQWSSKMADWQHNVRAVALTLQALRAVDRYGAAGSGEQYRGWKALPSASGEAPSHMTSDEAIGVLWSAAGLRSQPREGVDPIIVYKAARAAAHPDRNGGDRAVWDQVEQAWLVLSQPASTRGRVLT